MKNIGELVNTEYISGQELTYVQGENRYLVKVMNSRRMYGFEKYTLKILGVIQTKNNKVDKYHKNVGKRFTCCRKLEGSQNNSQWYLS